MRFGRGHLLASQQRVDSRGQLALGGGRLDVVAVRFEAVLIVDAAAIANRVLGVEHDDLGSPRGAHLVGDGLVQILENRKADFMHPRERGNLGHGILTIRIDSQKHHALIGVLLGQLGQAGSIELCQRTFGAKKRQHHDLALADFV